MERGHDHVWVAVDRTSWLEVALALEGFRILPPARGKDGADRLLVQTAHDEIDNIARNYRRVCIASGDGAFATLAWELRIRGVELEVIGHSPRSTSRDLSVVADDVLFFHSHANQFDEPA